MSEANQSLPSPKKIAQKKGAYLGLILGALLVLAYTINWDLFLHYGYEVAKLPLVLFFAGAAAVKARKIYPVNFSFRDGFSVFFITVVIGLGISLVLKWLFYNYIDPDFGKYINEFGIEKRKEQLELMGKEPTEISKEIQELRATFQLSFVNLFQEYVFRLIGYCIPATIVALILKTKKPIIR